jgi:hypothetical protein
MLPKLMTLSRCRAESANSAPQARTYPCLREEVEIVERASAEVAEEAEWEETEEKVRSGEEYEEIAGVAGTDGDGDEARTGSDRASSRDCGSSMTCEVAERILKPQLLSHQSRGGVSMVNRSIGNCWHVHLTERGCGRRLLGTMARSEDEV